jgi:MFS family permease
MHQIVSPSVDSSRRWWVLATVVAAQFMFGVDAFIVNVAIPTISSELHASPAQIEAVIAVYLIAYATLVVTGGRLGDIYGIKNVFLTGVLGFTATSLWCGLAQSGPELIAARLAQGAAAALMVPQVLATLHLLFSDQSRGRAFGIYGIVLGLAGAAGFLLGGLLVTLDLAGLGWRAVFFVNGPFGLIIIAAALRIMPPVPRRAGTRLDIAGAIVLFAGLLCLIGPLLFGHDAQWAPWIWLVMATGVAILIVFPRFERMIANRGGMPLIDLALLSDAAFMRGLTAAFCFFFANLSFYLVMTMFLQKALHVPPLRAGMIFLPLTLTFVIASRHSAARARHRGTRVLIEGCMIQIAALAILAVLVASIETPATILLALVLAMFGYGRVW